MKTLDWFFIVLAAIAIVVSVYWVLDDIFNSKDKDDDFDNTVL